MEMLIQLVKISSLVAWRGCNWAHWELPYIFSVPIWTVFTFVNISPSSNQKLEEEKTMLFLFFFTRTFGIQSHVINSVTQNSAEPISLHSKDKTGYTSGYFSYQLYNVGSAVIQILTQCPVPIPGHEDLSLASLPSYSPLAMALAVWGKTKKRKVLLFHEPGGQSVLPVFKATK